MIMRKNKILLSHYFKLMCVDHHMNNLINQPGVFSFPVLPSSQRIRDIYQGSVFGLKIMNTKQSPHQRKQEKLTMRVISKRTFIIVNFLSKSKRRKWRRWILWRNRSYSASSTSAFPPLTCTETSDCMQFVINGPTEVAKKLNNIETVLRAFRPQTVFSSHIDYVSLVRNITFVVLSQPISTHCTIASDVSGR